MDHEKCGQYRCLSPSAVLAGCDDPPTAELDAAKQALDSARDVGAERFAANEYSAAQRTYSEAEATTSTEAERFFPLQGL